MARGSPLSCVGKQPDPEQEQNAARPPSDLTYRPGGTDWMMLIARAALIAITEMLAWTMVSSFALRERIGVSVG